MQIDHEYGFVGNAIEKQSESTWKRWLSSVYGSLALKTCGASFAYLLTQSFHNATIRHWSLQGHAHRYVVLKRGESLQQVDDTLIKALHSKGFEIDIETNGTLEVLNCVDLIGVSTKACAPRSSTRRTQTQGSVPPTRTNTR